MDNLLYNLNDAQRDAVMTTEGYVCVIAGAGSGKTRALTYRYAYLVNVLGIAPKNIICSTFTNKAANEMRQRIRQMTGGQDASFICTFHSLCVAILQEDGHILHYPKNFRVLDNSDIRDILNIIYEEHGFTSKDMTFADAVQMIGTSKMCNTYPWISEVLSMSVEVLEQKYRKAGSLEETIFYGYLYHEKKMFGLDFNDLIAFTLYLFDISKETELKWQKRCQYVMVDEYQDISFAQKAIMSILSSYHKNLFVVGDSDQTIYSWRGSKSEFIQNFSQERNGTKTVFMNLNYRSTPEIIAAANSLIDKNSDRIKKELESTRLSGQPVLCNLAGSTEDEALWICDEILSLQEKGVSLSDIAILYRSHYVSRQIEQAFLEWEIPYKMYSGIAFYERKEIKYALSYLSMLAFQDDLSFLRIINSPKRNIGKRRIKILQEYAEEKKCSLYMALKQNIELDIIVRTEADKFIEMVDSLAKSVSEKSVSEIFAEVLDKSGFEEMMRREGDQDKLDNLAELKQSIFDYEATNGEESTLLDYLQHVSLLTNADLEEKKDKVKMMTIHAAKGLEFPYVFLCEMNEGVIPTKRTDTMAKMEEERRLAFVAMTRAKDGLYLSCADGFLYDGSKRYPSRFLLDIDKEFLKFVNEPNKDYLEFLRNRVEYLDHLMVNKEKNRVSVGQRIKHTVFGEGTIIEIEKDNGPITVQFDNMESCRSFSSSSVLFPAEQSLMN